jgi:hypothetical protein
VAWGRGYLSHTSPGIVFAYESLVAMAYYNTTIAHNICGVYTYACYMLLLYILKPLPTCSDVAGMYDVMEYLAYCFGVSEMLHVTAAGI